MKSIILNGIGFALDKVCLENIYFLDIVKILFKIGIFIDEEMIHYIILTNIKLEKKLEITKNMNLIHICFMEKYKNYILNKWDIKIVENKSIKDNNKENDNDKEENKECESRKHGRKSRGRND